MRTTVNIDEYLLEEAKVTAARGRRSLGDVIDDALRALFVERGGDSAVTRRVVLPTSGGSGVRSGVDLEDNESLAEVLGENRVLRAAE
jgi:hypothetical protein